MTLFCTAKLCRAMLLRCCTLIFLVSLTACSSVPAREAVQRPVAPTPAANTAPPATNTLQPSTTPRPAPSAVPPTRTPAPTALPPVPPLPPAKITTAITSTVKDRPYAFSPNFPEAKFAFADARHGWFGEDTALYVTIDGGAHWQLQYITGSPIRRIAFSSLKNGIIETQLGWIVTSDGGTTWQPSEQTLPVGAADTDRCGDEGSLFMLNAQIGLKMCASIGRNSRNQDKVLYRTENGGKTWQEIGWTTPFKTANLSDWGYFRGWSFINTQQGWMAQGIGGLLKTTDGGRTWRGVGLRGIPPGENELSIKIALPYFVSVTQGFIHVYDYGRLRRYDGSTYATLYRTIDGGATWAQVFTFPVPDPEPKNFFRLVDEHNGFGVGSDDDMGAVFISKNHGSDWRQVGSLGSACEGDIFDGVNDVNFLDRQYGWANTRCSKPYVSRTSHLAQTTDGGKTWKTVNIIHNHKVYFDQISFINPSVGYVRQSTGELFVTHDGGVHLALVAKNINYLGAMRFADEQHGWIGDGSTINVTDDGGKTWHRLAQPATARAFGVFPNGDAWLVSVKGTLFFLHQEDDLWTKYEIWGMRNGGPGIQFTDRLHGWSISEDEIYYTQDGGAHWVQVRRRERGR